MLATSVDKAMQICTSTVDLARGDQAVNHREPVPLHELVGQVGVSLGLDDDSDVRWQNDVDPGLVVDADRERLFRVFLNLGKNAVNALVEQPGTDHGRITITARKTRGGTLMDVADNGPGLPDKALQHLFQPFVGSTSRGGNGLGLTTARDLMRAHQGELSLYQSSEQGTVFRLELPIVGGVAVKQGATGINI